MLKEAEGGKVFCSSTVLWSFMKILNSVAHAERFRVNLWNAIQIKRDKNFPGKNPDSVECDG